MRLPLQKRLIVYYAMHHSWHSHPYWSADNYTLYKQPQGPQGTAYLPIFLRLAQHDYSSALELPHHSPKVVHCSCHRGLGRHVRILLLVSLHNGLVSNRAMGHPELTHIEEAGVDVLCPRDSGGLEADSVHVI